LPIVCFFPLLVFLPVPFPKKRENLERAVGFIFSRSGFTKEAEEYCRERGIACSEDERWLESRKLKSPLV
jgi:hypothetical protein